MLGDPLRGRRLALVASRCWRGGGWGAGASTSRCCRSLVSVEGVRLILFAVPAPPLMSGSGRDARSAPRRSRSGALHRRRHARAARAPLFIAAASWRAFWLALAAAAVLATLVLPAGPAGQPARCSLRLVRESSGAGQYRMGSSCLLRAKWTSVMVWLPTSCRARRLDGCRASAPRHGAGQRAGKSRRRVAPRAGVPGGTLVIRASIVGALRGRMPRAASARCAALRAGVDLFRLAGVIPASIFAGCRCTPLLAAHCYGNGMVLQLSNLGQFFGPLASPGSPALAVGSGDVGDARFAAAGADAVPRCGDQNRMKR